MVCAGKLRFSAFQRTPCELCSFITFHFIVNSVKTFPENENGRKALSSAEASYIYIYIYTFRHNVMRRRFLDRKNWTKEDTEF